MHGRLALNRDQVDECRKLARHIAEHLQKITERHTTLAIEQAALRVVGAASSQHHPIIHAIAKKLGVQAMKLGVSGWLGRTMVARKLSPEKAAEYLASHGLGRRDEIEAISWNQAQRVIRDAAEKWQKSHAKVVGVKPRNGQFRTAVQVASGSSDRDASQIKVLRDKADLVMVSVPATTASARDGIPMQQRTLLRRKGYALQVAMQRAAEQGAASSASSEVCWQGSGTPETAVVAASLAKTRLGADPIGDIAIHHTDPKKAFTDYGFLLRLSVKTGLRLQGNHSVWGDAEFLNTHIHQVVALQMVMEQWLMQLGGEPDQQSVILAPNFYPGGAPDLPAALASNQLHRELFPQAELWQTISPHNSAWDVGTAAMSGFCGGVVDASHVAQLNQVREWGKAISPLAYECQFNDHGLISRRMHTLLERSLKELTRLYRTGLSRVLEQDHGGLLAAAKSQLGAETVIEKDRRYWNPLDDLLRS